MRVNAAIVVGCPSFKTAFDNGYFVQDEKSKMTITSWWQGSNAGLIDFTNEGKNPRNSGVFSFGLVKISFDGS